MEQTVKCLVVNPHQGRYQEVTRFFAEKGVSYGYVFGENTIFANLIGGEYPVLDSMAEVFDPVVEAGPGEWYYVDGIRSLELFGPYKTEHDARVGFKIFVSWSEFVDNAKPATPS